MRVLTGLLALLLLTGFAAQSAEAPRDWPEGWRQGYERFQNFLRVRAEKWPVTEFSIDPDGRFHTVLWSHGSKGSQGLELFGEGVKRGEMSVREAESGPLRILNILTMGQPICLATTISTSFGDQHIFPLRWYEIVPAPTWEMGLYGGERRTYRSIPQPQPEAAFWPNERLLSWLDFQGMTKNRSDIREANRRVKPAAFIQIDELGVVHRANVFPSREESLLRWRVFCNGRLVSEEVTGGKESLSLLRFGAGHYIVLLGLNGPDGFFPISNLLKFSLAPRDGVNGLRLLFFHKFNYNDPGEYPEWCRVLFPRPVGTGPDRFGDKKQLEAALKLVAAWNGSLELENTPDAAWIYRPPVPAEPNER